MERNLFSFSILILVASLILGGCQKGKDTLQITFKPWGIEVKGVRPGVRLRLYDTQRELILAYPPLWGENQRLIFSWNPGKHYLLEYEGHLYPLKAPDSNIISSLEIFAPWGQPPLKIWLYQKEKPFWETPFPAKDILLTGEGNCFEVGLLVTSFTEKLLIEIGPKQFSLGRYEKHLENLPLCFENSFEKKIAIKIGLREILLPFRWERRSLDRAVELLSWELPTDAYGYQEKRRLKDTLVVPNPFWEKLAYHLGIKAKGFSRYEPFAYQCLVLKNRLSVPLTFLIKGAFLEPGAQKIVRGFYPPRFFSHGQFREPLVLVRLPARGRAKAVLPIFVSQEISSGEYLARVEIYAFGAKKPLLVREKRFGVVRGSPIVSEALLLILIFGGSYTIFLLLRIKYWLEKFPLRELTLLALTGAVGFGLDFLGGLLSNVLYAFLGPFNILVGGLITEIAHYLVLTAVLWLLPRPAVVTISGIITYFMGCILFGGFRFTDPFFLGARLLVLEVFVYLANKARYRAKALIFALAVADALNTAISLLLHMAFYRLFFPSWYIWLSVLVKGFLYTLLGAFLGVQTGKLLQKVER